MMLNKRCAWTPAEGGNLSRIYHAASLKKFISARVVERLEYSWHCLLMPRCEDDLTSSLGLGTTPLFRGVFHELVDSCSRGDA